MLDYLFDQVVIREATMADVPEIAKLRREASRKFVGSVDLPPGIQWLVAAKNGRVLAVVGFGIHPHRTLLVTDIYCEDSIEGRRALLGPLLDDMAAFSGKILATIPLDRPSLIRALKRRGMQPTGLGMERDSGSE